MKKFLLFIACLVIALPSTSYAHVLITDKGNNTGTVLHVTPNDDPIAGEQSNLFFDIKRGTVSYATHSFSLTVTDQYGGKKTIPMEAINTNVSATYTFPSRGLYTIILSAEPVQSSGRFTQFVYTQSVSRGVNRTNSTAAANEWSRVGIVVSLFGLSVLTTIFFINRQRVALHSKQQKYR